MVIRIFQPQIGFEIRKPHPDNRGFLSSTREKGLCRNRVKSLLSMRKPSIALQTPY